MLENASSVTELMLDRNTMSVLFRELFKGLHNRRILTIFQMDIEQTEGTFEDLVRLKLLNAGKNKLLILPPNLSSQSRAFKI